MAKTERAKTDTDLLAYWLDSRFRIPGTDIRFGLDPIVGLVPGLGDWLAGLISLYFIGKAATLGAGAAVLTRMFGNILLDITIGSIPVLGELFDVAWKANERNARLLEKIQTQPEEATFKSRLLIWGLALLFMLLIIAFLAVVFWILSTIFGLLFG